MSQFTIEIKGVDRLKRALNHLGSSQIYRDLTPAMQDGLDLIVDRISTYPKKKNRQSKYRRTGTLGRSWKSELVLSTELKGKVGTKLSYAPYVQGDEKQAKIHQGTWETLLEVTEKEESKIQEIFQDYVDDIIQKFNSQG